MGSSRNISEQAVVLAAWAMPHAPTILTRRRSTVSSAGSRSPMQRSGCELKRWRRLLHHGLLLLLHDWLLLLHGQLLLLHDHLLPYDGWLPAGLLLLFLRRAWRGY